MVPAPYKLRPCEPADEDAAYRVCLETGDDGQDAAPLYDDPKALGHIYVGPYLKFEPDLAFVLEDGNGVCGYVLGALDSKRFYEAYLTQWLPKLCQLHPEPTGDPAAWTRTQRTYYDYYHPDLYCPEPYAEYPSHLHIDLSPRAQGQGLGREMMKALLDELEKRMSPGVHLGMAAANARAERFYRKLGFRELTQVRDMMYLGKRIDPFSKLELGT